MTASDEQATDASLIAAAQSGDRAALERLLVRWQPRILRFGVKMCGQPEDARDVAQETLLAAARTLPNFRGDSSPSTWLYTIARSFCIKMRRRGRSIADSERVQEREGEDLAARIADARPLPDATVAAKEIEAKLDAAIAGLEPMYREVLVLRDVEGLTAPEVGDVLGLSVEAVKSRLHRARGMVRAEVAPALDDSAPPPPACPDVVTLYSQEVEGEISADLCATMERHLAGCAYCRGRCDGMRRVLAMCSAAPLPKVPPELQDAVRRAVRSFVTLP